MLVEGKHTIDIPLERLWPFILDRSILEEVTPGVNELEEVEPNKYKATSEVKMGPVRGRFTGDLQVCDITEKESFTLSLTQQSKVGTADADIVVHLTSSEDKTEVSYKGDARLTGVIGRLGQRVLGGVIKTMAGQFFDNLEKKLKTL